MIHAGLRDVTPERIFPEVLILASRYDLACDYVVSRLRARGQSYLRLNSEDLAQWSLTLDPARVRLEGRCPMLSFSIGDEDLRGIWFRRPVFLRECGSTPRSAQDQFSRAQWASFVRSCMMFEGCRWMNHPTCTFRAENKAVQLTTAAKIGLKIPATAITNSADALESVSAGAKEVAVKGLDTVILREDDFETFGYTSLVPIDEVLSSELTATPLIIQQALTNKLDLRVTVVDQEVFCASITEDGKWINGDWRLRKGKVSFKAFDLPAAISSMCVDLTQRLGLSFGAIDLALRESDYYFLEVNPTGEWAWLVRDVGFEIDDAIARYLIWQTK